jgi:hypothetical protein
MILALDRLGGSALAPQLGIDEARHHNDKPGVKAVSAEQYSPPFAVDQTRRTSLRWGVIHLTFMQRFPFLRIQMETCRREGTLARIDVINPCYDYGRFLDQCVNSVLGQQGVDVRVLVIDDASTDNTAEVAAALAREDPR